MELAELSSLVQDKAAWLCSLCCHGIVRNMRTHFSSHRCTSCLGQLFVYLHQSYSYRLRISVCLETLVCTRPAQLLSLDKLFTKQCGRVMLYLTGQAGTGQERAGQDRPRPSTSRSTSTSRAGGAGGTNRTGTSKYMFIVYKQKAHVLFNISI